MPGEWEDDDERGDDGSDAAAGVDVAFAALGVAWNVFGIVQLVDVATQTQAGLMMKGMTPPAAQLYYGLPVWMKLVFAIGSFGGLIGSLMLSAGRRVAIPIFAVSLAGYVALFAGDYAYGVFDGIPGQMAVLRIVIAVAVALLVASLLARRHGLFGLQYHRDPNRHLAGNTCGEWGES